MPLKKKQKLFQRKLRRFRKNKDYQKKYAWQQQTLMPGIFHLTNSQKISSTNLIQAHCFADQHLPFFCLGQLLLWINRLGVV